MMKVTKIKKERPPSGGRYYTIEDYYTILDGLRLGLNVKNIADKVGRTEAAIRQVIIMMSGKKILETRIAREGFARVLVDVSEKPFEYVSDFIAGKELSKDDTHTVLSRERRLRQALERSEALQVTFKDGLYETTIRVPCGGGFAIIRMADATKEKSLDTAMTMLESLPKENNSGKD